MSTKTSFKRVALAVVVALGLGMFATSPASNAAIVGQTLTLSASTATVAQGETATVSVTLAFTPTDTTKDSVTVLSSCSGPASCPSDNDAGKFFWGPAPDSATSVTVLRTSAFTALTTGAYATSYIMSGNTNGAGVSSTVSFKVVVPTDQTVGTYNYTIYTSSSTGGAAATPTTSDKTASFAVTVTAANTTPTSVRSYITTDVATANYWMTRSATQSSKDSAVVVDRGTLTSTNLTRVATVGIQALNSAGETRTVTQSLNICKTGCAITASLSGVGALAAGTGSTVARTSAVKSVAMVVYNNDYSSASTAALETISVYSDGTAGTGTITFYNGAASLGSVSVTFTGDPASAAISLSDTTVAVGQSSVVIKGYVKDSAGTLYSNTTKSLYVYASDTKVVTGALSTDSAQFTQRAAGLVGAATACSYDATLGYFNCALTIADTGTATITLRDSWTVAASSFVSNEVVLTALGVVAKSYTVAFDKATYAPGERATITITGLDAAGRAVSNGANGAGLTVTMLDTPSLGTSPKAGTNAAGAASAGTFKGYVTDLGVETGIETRVVTMPSYGGDVKFELTYTPVLSTTAITVSADAKVVNPQDALIAAAQDAAVAAAKAAQDAAVAAAKAAQDAAVAAAEKASKEAVAAAEAATAAANAATAAAKAAQDAAVAEAQAATDAAAEAIDAANAATDAGNLAAEAADAATVAAEEARDAADAATAAVEELATQVATLMAALQAQIKTLANTVAKIAKKVKA